MVMMNTDFRSQGPMTKGEARTLIRDAKLAIKRAERSIAFGDVHGLADDVRLAGGCVGEIESAADRGDLDHWKRVCFHVKDGGQFCREPAGIDGLCFTHHQKHIGALA